MNSGNTQEHYTNHWSTMFGWVCALSLLGLSASKQPNFYYSNLDNRKTDACTLCYADNDCLVLDQLHCDYYVEVDGLLHDEDVVPPEGSSQKRADVDVLMHEYVEKAITSPELDCIPYISQYTNCHKENVCLGCTSCTCASEGRWNCGPAQLCHTPEPLINIDHRVLGLTIENIMDTNSKRKRSVTKEIVQNTDGKDEQTNPMSYQQITDWLYGDEDVKNDSTTLTTDSIGTSLTTITSIEKAQPVSTQTLGVYESTTNINTDYVEFDDVLQNIAIDTKNYTRRKPLLDLEISNTTFDVDYMLLRDMNDTQNGTDEYGLFVNLLDDDALLATTETTTAVVVDLLKSVTKSDLNTNYSDNLNLENNKDEDIAALFSNPNDLDDFNVVNIMKRDVSGVTYTSVNNTTKLPPVNKNDTTVVTNKTNLKQDILEQLNKIIYKKYQDINDLKTLKKHLHTYLKSQKSLSETEIDPIVDHKLMIDIEKVDENVTTFEEYNDLQSNPELYNKYLKKLKADIFIVLKDVVNIQKYKTTVLPKDVLHLIRAMKFYATDNRTEDTKTNGNFRRNTRSDHCTYKTLKECLVLIIQVIDAGMPTAYALSPLSVTTQKIMTSIIKHHYTDDLSYLGLRVSDKQYNITKDLESISTDWHDLNSDLVFSTPFEVVFRMKLLHVVLNMDINKMRDALTLITFKQNRRMDQQTKTFDSRVLQKINKSFEAISKVISGITEFYSPKQNSVKYVERSLTTTEKPNKNGNKKKYSFIRYISNLLKTSKNDIAALLHKKVPKSDIVKHLARKKLDQLSQKRYDEYQQTMTRWQNNLNVVPRSKRSIMAQLTDNMKSIIPKYLRHKVRPKIQEKYKNGTLAKQDAKKKKKRKHGNRKEKSPENKPKNKLNSTTIRAITLTTSMTKAAFNFTTTTAHSMRSPNIKPNLLQLHL